MYIPKPFSVDNKALIQFIQANAFGQLISHVNGQLFCTHLPFIIDAKGTSLYCHMAKQNPQWEQFAEQTVLVIFNGPHGYISPTWYSTVDGVPTWNYQTVHAYGQASLIDNEKQLTDLLDQLTQDNESQLTTPAWQAQTYTTTQLNAIIGIKITLSSLQGKFKLSQNRPASDQQNIIQKLTEQGNQALAQAIKTQTA